MAKAILLMGKIASGKSHYAENYTWHNRAMILSCDELFYTLFDGCLGEKHREMERRAYEFFCGQAVQLVRLGIDALLDFGFWTTDSRMKATAFFEGQGVPMEIWYFETEDGLRRQRLAERNKQRQAARRWEYIIDEDMLGRFDAIFEPPGKKEQVIRIND
jgi:predicted kinase